VFEVLSALLILVGGVFTLGFALSPKRKKRRNPTRKQLDYLEGLVEANNGYRATPLELEDWIEKHARGSLTFHRASSLIRRLKRENDEKRERLFLDRGRARLDLSSVRPRAEISSFLASDFGAYGFCSNSFFFTLQGAPNRNFYELDEGRACHEKRRGPSRFGGPFRDKNSEWIQSEVSGVHEVKWFTTRGADVLEDSELGLRGIPDGVIYHLDGSCSVVELKSKRSLGFKSPWLGDVLQACAYHNILQSESRKNGVVISPRIFILYVGRGAKGKVSERKLFEADYHEYETSFFNALGAMKKTTFRPDLYRSGGSRKKCQSCGHRKVCARWTEKALRAG
jgi:CRISPR/Cas system-associated exonuclease Cas4 (RecB family)